MLIPFALSLDKYVNKAGTDVGFGCLLAVALLALLYFAGARETRSLRDQLDDAHNRIAALEARVNQALRNQTAARAQPQAGQMPHVPGRPGVVPAPSVAVSGAGALRIPREGGPATHPMTTVTGALLGAPAGAGAPSLGSATKLIPSPEAAPTPAPAFAPTAAPAHEAPGTGTPAAVPAGATAAMSVGAAGAYAELDDRGYDDEFEPDDTMFVPAGATAAAGGGGRSRGSAVTPAPSMRFGDSGEPPGSPPRRTIPTIDNGPSGPRRFAGRLTGLVVALVVVAAIVVALLLVTTSGGSKQSKTTSAARGTIKTHKTTKPVFKPASVKVSVLNGTGQAGLAGDVATLIKKSGYTVPPPAITNAAVQTDANTTVGFRTGFRADAFRVAKALTAASKVDVNRVVAANAAAITSCATPTATGQAGTCPADVIITVGSDLESAANGSSGA